MDMPAPVKPIKEVEAATKGGLKTVLAEHKIPHPPKKREQTGTVSQLLRNLLLHKRR